MLKRSSKEKQLDENQIVFNIVQKATFQEEPTSKPAKNPYAVALGRLGGLKGGKARAASLSAKKRRSIAKKAARSRWKK